MREKDPKGNDKEEKEKLLVERARKQKDDKRKGHKTDGNNHKKEGEDRREHLFKGFRLFMN